MLRPAYARRRVATPEVEHASYRGLSCALGCLPIMVDGPGFVKVKSTLVCQKAMDALDSSAWSAVLDLIHSGVRARLYDKDCLAAHQSQWIDWGSFDIKLTKPELVAMVIEWRNEVLNRESRYDENHRALWHEQLARHEERIHAADALPDAEYTLVACEGA